jgi:hypothetical protein
MEISPLGQGLSFLQYLREEGKIHQESSSILTSQPANSSELASSPSVTSSYDLSFSYEYAVRMRMELGTQPAGSQEAMPREIEESHEDRHGDRVSRRTARKGVKRALKHLAQEVDRALHQFVKENHDLLDEDLRNEIVALGREFRHDLRDAFHSGFSGRRADMEAVSQGAQQAFANLIGGLQELASRVSGEEVVPPEQPVDPDGTVPAEGTVAPSEVAETATGNIASAVETTGTISYTETRTGQVETVTSTGGSSFVSSATYKVAVAVQVSFSTSFSYSNENVEGQDLFGRLGHILAEFQDSLAELLVGGEQGEFDVDGFLTGLREALDKLANDLQGLIGEDPTSAEGDSLTVPPVHPPVESTPPAQPELPAEPQVVPYDPVLPVGRETAEQLELTA